MCLIHGWFGAKQLERIGVDNVLSEGDYPHPDSQWSHMPKVLEELLYASLRRTGWGFCAPMPTKLFHLEIP